MIKSNYVAAIDMGSKADKITKRRDLYIYKDEKVHPLPKNKNNLLALLIDQNNKAEDFIKGEKLRLNKENDLVKLVQFLNH